jgi:hypothetical protein
MKNITSHTGVLKNIKRLPSSWRGNPRFEAYVEEGVNHGFKFRTQVDHSHGYSIQNYEGKEVTVAIGSHYGVPQLDSITGTNS